ncbi:hypothetical protein MMYC01_210141 [Madurella mycetomatis]|uniref:Uncharacterized protein n=1 Tax=Madurella mycetomatis TaxID=100816 RepID=A0A175VRE2_9PEZI|nr:hypothetical protein MMYC01_210141 [Madurella mycetomatis]
MPPSTKRSRAVAGLENGTPTGPKKRRMPDVIILASSDVETDEPYAEATRGRVVSRGLFEQLQEDAFFDLKTDLHLELDRLYRIGEDGILGGKGVPALSTGLTIGVASQRPSTEEAEEDLHEALWRWLRQDKLSRPTNCLLYRLDAQPGDDLPPGDQLVIDALDRLTAKMPFEVFMAIVEREDKGRQEPAPSYLARAIHDLQGHLLAFDVPADERNWVHTERSSPKPSSGFVTVVVLVPRDTVVDFLMESEVPLALTRRYCLQTTGVRRLVEYFTARILGSADYVRLLPVFKELCTRVWGLDEARGLAVLPSNAVEELLKVIVLAQDWKFFDQALSKLGSYPLSTFFEWIAGRIEAEPLAACDAGKRLAATGLGSPINVLRLGPPENGVLRLLRQLVTGALEGIGTQTLTAQDGRHLSELVHVVLGPGAVTLRLLPLVEQNPILHTSFALGVFDGLCQVTKFHPSSPPVPRELLERLARLITNSLDVSKFDSSSPRYQNFGCRCCHLIPQPVRPGSVEVTHFSSFVSGVLSEGIDDRILAVFALKVVRDIGLIKPSAFATFWLPFLRELLGILEKNNNAALSAPRYHHLFAAVLETYLNRCVGPPPIHWIPECQYVPCACRLCSLINRFLRSSIWVASISLISNTEVIHLNSWPLMQYANWIQCKFTVKDGVVIVEKLMAIEQGPSFELWRKKRNEASAEIGKLDDGQLRTVLGDSYSSIVYYDPVQLTGRSSVAHSLHSTHRSARSQPNGFAGRQIVFSLTHDIYCIAKTRRQANHVQYVAKATPIDPVAASIGCSCDFLNSRSLDAGFYQSDQL